jgi:uncharacterized membrane protein
MNFILHPINFAYLLIGVCCIIAGLCGLVIVLIMVYNVRKRSKEFEAERKKKDPRTYS